MEFRAADTVDTSYDARTEEGTGRFDERIELTGQDGFNDADAADGIGIGEDSQLVLGGEAPVAFQPPYGAGLISSKTGAVARPTHVTRAISLPTMPRRARPERSEPESRSCDRFQ